METSALRNVLMPKYFMQDLAMFSRVVLSAAVQRETNVQMTRFVAATLPIAAFLRSARFLHADEGRNQGILLPHSLRIIILPSPIPPLVMREFRVLGRSCLASFVALLISLSIPSISIASTPFRDVPENDDVLFPAVQFLQTQGVLQGYADGTFRPTQKVKRAEAVKIVIASTGTSESNILATTSRSFSDVPKDSWYATYVEWAFRKMSLIDGPPKTSTFRGDTTVKKAEFIKMLLRAHGMDPNSYGEVKIPLSPDVSNANEWYYPYMRLSVATSMTVVGSSGLFRPERELTREDVAILTHRLLLYKAGKRTQDLLTEAESEIEATLKLLEKKDVTKAEHSSARALLAARGAHASLPNHAIVKSAVKLTEAVRALVRAYRAGVETKFDDTIKLSKDAWFLADQAINLSSSVTGFAQEVQSASQSLADQARSAKGKK